MLRINPCNTTLNHTTPSFLCIHFFYSISKSYTKFICQHIWHLTGELSKEECFLLVYFKKGIENVELPFTFHPINAWAFLSLLRHVRKMLYCMNYTSITLNQPNWPFEMLFNYANDDGGRGSFSFFRRLNEKVFLVFQQQQQLLLLS